MFVKKIHHIEVEMAIRTSLDAYADETNGEINSVSDLSKKRSFAQFQNYIDNSSIIIRREKCYSSDGRWVTRVVF